jgi:hypothetical protein
MVNHEIYFERNNIEKYRLLLSIATRKAYERSLRRGDNRGELLFIEHDKIAEIAASVENKGGVISAADDLLMWLGDTNTSFSEYHRLASGIDYPLASCRTQIEFVIVMEYLRSTGLLVEKSSRSFTENSDFDIKLEFRITPKGFERILELRKTKHKTAAFIAMWFDSSLGDVYESAMKKAIEDVTILKPVRADKEEHNDDINDWILGQIRMSAFMIADFTGNRGGVYLEAGYALGLGIPVIFTCKDVEKDKKELHFDTNHRNHIFWKDGGHLCEKLADRIRATIPMEYLK